MQDTTLSNTLLEVEPILSLDGLPRIAAPHVALGPRSIEWKGAAEPLSIADARPFQVELGAMPPLGDDAPSPEQGKRRG